jgi:hypothetical protein
MVETCNGDMKMTNRKYAEQCRREALSIEAQSATTAAQEELRSHLVSVWNGFCVEEQRRMDRNAKSEAAVYILPSVHRRQSWTGPEGDKWIADGGTLD